MLLALAGGCVQSDQTLPFEARLGQPTSATIGPAGGSLGIAPDLFLDIPANALDRDVFVAVTRRVVAPFPTSAGRVLPGTAFDLGPAGVVLGNPGTVELAVPAASVTPEEVVRLAVAFQRADGGVHARVRAYDAVSGILSADVSELGPLAAIIADDYLPVDLTSAPGLTGGELTDPGTGPTSTPVSYSTRCGDDAVPCMEAASIRVWGSSEVRTHLGENLALIEPEVTADLTFSGFDTSGRPSVVEGGWTIRGVLRAGLASGITSVEIDEDVRTGVVGALGPTALVLVGDGLVIGESTAGRNERFDFGVEAPPAGGTRLSLRLEIPVEFERTDGSIASGDLVVHLGLDR